MKKFTKNVGRSGIAMLLTLCMVFSLCCTGLVAQEKTPVDDAYDYLQGVLDQDVLNAEAEKALADLLADQELKDFVNGAYDYAVAQGYVDTIAKAVNNVDTALYENAYAAAMHIVADVEKFVAANGENIATDTVKALESAVAAVEAVETEEELLAALEDLNAAMETIYKGYAADALVNEIENDLNKMIPALENALESLAILGESLDTLYADLEKLAGLINDQIPYDQIKAEMEAIIADIEEQLAVIDAEIAKLFEELKAAGIAGLEDAIAEFEAKIAELEVAVEKAIAEATAAIEEVTVEVEAAFAALEARFAAALLGDYTRCYDHDYVAIGGVNSTADSYVKAVAEYIGAEEATVLAPATIETVVANIAENQETLETASLITYNVEAMDLVNIILSEEGANWDKYIPVETQDLIVEIITKVLTEVATHDFAVDAETLNGLYEEAKAEALAAAAEYVDVEILAEAEAVADAWVAEIFPQAVAIAEEVRAEVLANLEAVYNDETLQAAAPLIDRMVYATVAYAIETVYALEAIQEINDEALLVVAGMYNPLQGLTVAVEGETIDIGAAFDYVIEATSLYYYGYAVITEGAVFADTYSATTNGFGDKVFDLANQNDLIALLEALEVAPMLDADGQDAVADAIIGAINKAPVHAYDAVVTAPTCTEEGYTTYTCPCGDTYKDDIVPALGHTEKVVPAVAPTCTETGLTEGKVCSVCDVVLVEQKEVPALGHKFVINDKDEFVCATCGVAKGPWTDCPFTDIGHGTEKPHWAYNYIRYAYENKYMIGISDTLFAPDADTTRAMVVTILYRMAGEPAVDAEIEFTDLAEGKWYTEAMIWATENGILEGFGDGTCRPEAKVTREQYAAFMMRYAKFCGNDVSATADLSKFEDPESVSDWAKDEMGWAVAAGMIEGFEDCTVRGQDLSTRAQIAAVIYRFDVLLQK